ncbi:hypothetical protein Tco_1477089 [Tanacetum coccineum]
MDSLEVNDGSDVWKNQHTWSIQSWKLYSFSGVHVYETVSGLVLHMFVDKKYPLSVNLIERMLDHQLEICHRTVGNELTTAVQLIAFLKKQISDSKRPKLLLLDTVFAMLLSFLAVYFVQTEPFSGIGCWLTTAQQIVFNSPCLTDKKELIHHEGYASGGDVPKSVEVPGCYNKEWLVQEGTALGKDYIKSVNGCDDLPKIIRSLWRFELLCVHAVNSYVYCKDVSHCYNQKF